MILIEEFCLGGSTQPVKGEQTFTRRIQANGNAAINEAINTQLTCNAVTFY